MADLITRHRAAQHRMIIVTPPAAEVVTLAEQKAHMRVDHDDDDALIEAMITAAREHIDGVDGWLGRALVQQTWDMKLNGFPLLSTSGRIVVPLAPLIQVDQITYRDPAGQTQTLAPSVYHVVDGGSQRSFIVLERNQSWPGTDDRHDAVTVRFTAGYAASGDSPPDYAANVPFPIKAALMIMAADLYENREQRITGTIVAELPTVERLLMPYRTSWW